METLRQESATTELRVRIHKEQVSRSMFNVKLAHPEVGEKKKKAESKAVVKHRSDENKHRVSEDKNSWQEVTLRWHIQTY